MFHFVVEAEDGYRADSSARPVETREEAEEVRTLLEQFHNMMAQSKGLSPAKYVIEERP